MNETTHLVPRTPAALRRLADALLAEAVWQDVPRLRALHLLDQSEAARVKASTLGWAPAATDTALDLPAGRRAGLAEKWLAAERQRGDRLTRPRRRVPSRRALRQALARLGRAADAALWKEAPMP